KSQKQISYERLLEQERLLLLVTERIAEQMERSGVRKAELAERLGTSKSHITQALAGGRNLTLRTLADIAWALRCQVHVALPPTEGVDVSQSVLRIVPPAYDFHAHDTEVADIRVERSQPIVA